MRFPHRETLVHSFIHPMATLPGELLSVDIQTQLSRILASRDFAASRQLSQFLRFVIGESLAGRGESLTERAVAVGALDRDSDYDPQIDCAVRVAAGKLRHALDRYYSGPGADDPWRITLPKGTYRPQIIRANRSPDRAARRAPSNGAPDPAPLDRPVVAIWPFSSPRGNNELRHLADNIGMCTSVHISSFRWLDVIGSQAARRNGVRSDRRAAANSMGVDFLLTGLLSLHGTAVHVAVELLQVETGVAVWSDIYRIFARPSGGFDCDATVLHIGAAVGDFFGAIAQAMSNRVRDPGARPVTSMEALLFARQYLSTLEDEAYPRAVTAGEKAVRANPEFAWGWATLSQLYLARYCHVTERGPADAHDRALYCAKRAIAADPTCGYAHFVLGVHHLHSGRKDEAIAAAEQTLIYGYRSPFDVGCAGDLLSMAGVGGQGASAIDQALAANPRLPGFIRWGAAVNCISRGAYREALIETDRFSLPTCFWDWLLRAVALQRVGESAESVSSARRAVAIRPRLAAEPGELIGKFVQSAEVRQDILDSLSATGVIVDRRSLS